MDNNLITYLKNYLLSEGKIISYTILLTIITPIDYILYVKWIDSMQNYNWYASSFVFPLFGILFFSIGTYYYYFMKKIDYTNKISQKYLISMGVMDGLSSLLSCFSTPYLSIIVITILDKLCLPMILFSSIIYLNSVYYKNHYLGVFLTLYAVIVSFLPKFSNGQDNHWWAVIIFIISLFPTTASYVIKEKHLNDNTNIWWMNLYISIWQFLFGMLMLPFMFIPVGKEGINYIPINTINSYFREATKCQFLGINSKDNDMCESSFMLMISYQIISTIINVLMMHIINTGSSTYFVLINSLKLPIQAWLGSFKNISGQNYSPVSINDVFTFILIIVATIVYNDKNIVKNTNDNTSGSLNKRGILDSRFLEEENEYDSDKSSQIETLTI